MQTFLRYTPNVETIEPDEAETHAKIVEIMSKGVANVREENGSSVRISHGKTFGVLTGRLVVKPGLAAEYAQGLFATPCTYEVLVRMANAPGEINDDSKLQTARGMAIKVLGVEGPRLANETDNTQDWVLDTGKEFFVPNAKMFVQAFKPNAGIAPKLSDTVKGVVSSVAQVAAEGLKAVGIESQKLDFYGHPQKDPMAEAYFSQTAMRHGEYVAKLGVYPDTPTMEELEQREFKPEGYDALREATRRFFAANEAEFSVRIQLCTNLDEMPVEDAQAAWSEEASGYVEVARLILPAQAGWTPELDHFVENFSFNPANSVEDHRPLGSVARARLVAYKAIADLRLQQNGMTMSHIESTKGVPA